MRTRIAVLAGFLMLLPALVWPAEFTAEVRPFAGAFLATGEQRDAFEDATAVGASVAVETADYLHLLGTFAFTGPNIRGWAGRDHMHIYQSDVGAEMFRAVPAWDVWEIRPFLGLGAGVRTYDLTNAPGTKSYVAGYGALGAEVQRGMFALRIEGRDYVSRFRGFAGNEDAETRNDILLTVGIAYHVR